MLTPETNQVDPWAEHEARGRERAEGEGRDYDVSARVLPCGCSLDGRMCRDHAPPSHAPPLAGTAYSDATYFDARLDNAAVDFLTEAHRRAWLAQRHDDCLRHLRRLSQIRGSDYHPRRRARAKTEEQLDYDDAVRDREPWVD